MYNKHGNVLRVETVVNRPYEFKLLWKGKRNGKEVTGWFPMGQAVGNLYRYAEVSRQANGAYLDTLAGLDPGKPDEQTLHELSRKRPYPLRYKGKRIMYYNMQNGMK